MNKGNEKSSGFSFLIVRTLFLALGAYGGYLFADFLMAKDIFRTPINLLYMSLVGLLIGYVVGTPLASYSEIILAKVRARFAKISPQTILASGIGLTMALIISVLLNTLLEKIPGFTWYWSLILTVVLATASMWFFTANKQLLSGFASPQKPLTDDAVIKKHALQELVLDTSAIIDGRIFDVVETNFLIAKILIPKFVLAELQNIADSSDNLRRTKGRRGLEVLDKLIRQKTLETEVISDDFPDIEEVDEKLIRLCQARSAYLVTTDYNLNRVASLQSIRVLNVNQLANAIRPVYLPGENLALYISKIGREPDQGLAYLDDGTMVVVEDTARFVGRSVDAVVTSQLQTNMGRIIFAKLAS